jgi:hypothetical protein
MTRTLKEGLGMKRTGRQLTRIGKIARLPVSIRRQLNERLNNGQLSPEILPWLNSLPEVRRVTAKFFARHPINAQNLSDWRRGGFLDWGRLSGERVSISLQLPIELLPGLGRLLSNNRSSRCVIKNDNQKIC